MADFKQAIEWMRDGKKVYLTSWTGKTQYAKMKSRFPVNIVWNDGIDFDILDLDRIASNDWEIFEEKVELKTLKDIDWYGDDSMLKGRLKKEAIKHIKELRKNFKHGKFNFSCDMQDNLEEYIKWNNNLTDEDLK